MSFIKVMLDIGRDSGPKCRKLLAGWESLFLQEHLALLCQQLPLNQKYREQLPISSFLNLQSSFSLVQSKGTWSLSPSNDLLTPVVLMGSRTAKEFGTQVTWLYWKDCTLENLSTVSSQEGNLREGLYFAGATSIWNNSSLITTIDCRTDIQLLMIFNFLREHLPVFKDVTKSPFVMMNSSVAPLTEKRINERDDISLFISTSKM